MSAAETVWKVGLGEGVNQILKWAAGQVIGLITGKGSLLAYSVNNTGMIVPRDATGEHPMLFHFNTTHLRGQDLQKLEGLNVTSLGADGAIFATNHFNTLGNLTARNHTAYPGIIHGEAAFPIPGLEEPAEGTWISVDPTNADVPEAMALKQLHSALLTASLAAPENPGQALVDGFFELVNNMTVWKEELGEALQIVGSFVENVGDGGYENGAPSPAAPAPAPAAPAQAPPSPPSWNMGNGPAAPPQAPPSPPSWNAGSAPPPSTGNSAPSWWGNPYSWWSGEAPPS